MLTFTIDCPWRFIYSHNESEMNGKLTMKEIDRKFFRRVYSNPRDENLISGMFATQNVTPQDHRFDLQQNHVCAITKTIGRVEVVKQHKRTSRLESQMCKGKSRGIDRVKVLCRV